MGKTIYALGFFDGVHLGHRMLLQQCQELARQLGCKAGVVTFDTHPQLRLQGKSPRLITSVRDREKLLREQFSMEPVITLPFDEEMRTMPWQSFLQMLLTQYDAQGFVCGEDFRFGYKGQGNAPLLADFCGQRGIPCSVVPEQTIDGIRISSTYIRRQIETGDMETAVRFLGHPHIFSGEVVHGHALGRKLGFPTANLRLPEILVVPRFGVYACRAVIDGKAYPAVTNVGTRPTVEGTGITVEPWILDYSGDLYGREITLEFYRFLRPEMKFPDLQSLQEEIRRNGEQTRDFLRTLFTQ